MSIRDRVATLAAELPKEPQYPTQGATVFVDLQRREVVRGYTPIQVVKTLLAGRGANMFYLHRLLDESLHPLHPDVPLIFGSGVLTGIVPSAARGNATSWSPESGVIMDSNAGDHFPSFIRMNGIDHIVLFGETPAWTLLLVKGGRIEFVDAAAYVGLDNIDLRERIPQDFGGTWARDLAMVNVTRAGENQVLTSAIMAGPKACYARGGPGAKMGSLKVKAILVQGQTRDFETAQPYKGYNRTIAQKLLETSVVKHALKTTGTPFLYKPSRMLGAMGTKNNQETTWTDKLDSDHITPYRPGMAGCFRCPVNCRPLNELNKDPQDKYGTRGWSRVRNPRQVRAERRDRSHRKRHPPEQHLQRSRPRHGVHGIDDRVGDGALSARSDHAKDNRRPRVDVGQCRRRGAVALPDLTTRRIRECIGRRHAGSREGTFPARSAEVPHGGERVDAE